MSLAPTTAWMLARAAAWLAGLCGAAYIVADGMAGRDDMQRAVDQLWYRYEQAVESASIAPELGQQNDELASLLQLADTRLPVALDEAALVAALQESAAAAGLDVQSCEAADRHQREFYGVREVYLEASGPATAVSGLIAAQLAASPLRSVDQVSLQRVDASEGASIRVVLTIRFYDHRVAESGP